MDFSLAPSYANYKIVSEPFEKKGKIYVVIEHPNTHNKRDAICYDNCGKPLKLSGFNNLKECRGFAEGAIYIARYMNPAAEEVLKASSARLAANTGWYIVSTDTPFHDDMITWYELTWEEASVDDRHMKTKEEIDNAIKNKEPYNI